MAKQDKQRLYIIAGILTVAVVLLFLMRGKAVSGSTIVNNAGDIVMPGFNGVDASLSDLPALSYTSGDYISNTNTQKPCGMCFAGYSRNVLPAPPAAIADAREVVRYIQSQPIVKPSPPPRSYGMGGFSMSSTPSAPPAPNWFNQVGRFF